MKIISFSLWGNNPQYLGGAIDNAIVAPKIYPDWICRFYCDDRLSNDYLNVLREYGAEVILMKWENKGTYEGLFWRFLPFEDDRIERFISRDTDSILTDREAGFVKEWEESGYPFHIIRDHKLHASRILGGTFGSTMKFNLQNRINNWTDFEYDSDQKFLKEFIWPVIRDNHLAHDLCSNISNNVIRIKESNKYIGQKRDPSKFVRNNFSYLWNNDTSKR